MSQVILDGAHCPELVRDLESAVREFIEGLERDPTLWSRAPVGKWRSGQHADHLASTLALFANRLEEAERELRAGTLASPPRRGILQSLFLRLITGNKFPRGGKAPTMVAPAAAPDRNATLARLRGEVARFRALVDRLPPGDCDRLWMKNPFIKFRWHYALPEALRVQARHARHHGMLVGEIHRNT